VEEELSLLFPGARIARMDLDSTRSRTAFDKIISQLEHHKIDILAGTQMVTKGLDFGNVSVVGILNADHLINYPDFRAYERAFQLMTQVSGRSGRKEKKGCVVIQTSHPEHPVIQYVKGNDFEAVFNALMPERKLFQYPPWYRLVKIAVRHRDQARAAEASGWLADHLRSKAPYTVLGPESPLVSRVQQWYIREVWLKIARDGHAGDMQRMVTEAVEMTKKRAGNSGIVIQIDVDAV
jgi:primosomal protein N' (replication factor Y)